MTRYEDHTENRSDKSDARSSSVARYRYDCSGLAGRDTSVGDPPGINRTASLEHQRRAGDVGPIIEGVWTGNSWFKGNCLFCNFRFVVLEFNGEQLRLQ